MANERMVELEIAVWEYDCRMIMDSDDRKKQGKPHEFATGNWKLMLPQETSLLEIFANLAC